MYIVVMFGPKFIFLLYVLASTWCSAFPFGKTPKWSASYSVQGVIFIKYAGVQEPFKAWYDKGSGKSRIDYHNGMVKMYQLSDGESYGVAWKYIPETNTTPFSCIGVNGNNKFHIYPQSSLPDLRHFKIESKQIGYGINVEKWIYTSKERNIVRTYKMWLYRNNNGNTPLRFEMNAFNSELQLDFDEYVIEYKKFSPLKPDPSIFSIETTKCENIFSPGIHYVYDLNPMLEFMSINHNYVDPVFQEFKHKFNKMYINGTKEYFERKNNFLQNVRYIYSKNRANDGYLLAVNHMADYSNEELNSLCGHGKINRTLHEANPFPYDKNNFTNLPLAFDWRTKNAITPVKTQSYICESSWSCSVTGAIEGAYFLRYRERTFFSQQALIDCSSHFDNNGREGDEEFCAYSWIKKHGLPTVREYREYFYRDNMCHLIRKPNGSFTKISTVVNVTSFNEDALKFALVNHGPISISMYASLKSFVFYSSGVYYDRECRSNAIDLNHSALLIGYGTLNGQPYWIVKNSFSTSWGNDGYLLISRKNNNCGIMTNPTYVVL